MSEWNWCHGPNCHTYHTQGRIRGVKGNKVLRTRKIKIDRWTENTWHAYFCDERCRTNYIHKHLTAIINLEPRSEPLETSIELETVEDTDWRGNPYTYKKIVEANQ
jgi:phage terminase large subunit